MFARSNCRDCGRTQWSDDEEHEWSSVVTWLCRECELNRVKIGRLRLRTTADGRVYHEYPVEGQLDFGGFK